MIFQQQEFQPFVNTRAYFNWNVAIDLWTVTFQKWYPIFSAHGILHSWVLLKCNTFCCCCLGWCPLFWHLMLLIFTLVRIFFRFKPFHRESHSAVNKRDYLVDRRWACVFSLQHFQNFIIVFVPVTSLPVKIWACHFPQNCPMDFPILECAWYCDFLLKFFYSDFLVPYPAFFTIKG